MKLEFSRQIFEKYSNIKFHENLTSGSRVVPRGRTDMTKFMVAFPNSANAPKNFHIIASPGWSFSKKNRQMRNTSSGGIVLAVEKGITRSHSVEKSLYKRMWIRFKENRGLTELLPIQFTAPLLQGQGHYGYSEE